MENFRIKNTVIHTWIWIIVILMMIFGASIFTFYAVSHKGDLSWDYRPVQSLPASSPYAEYQKLPFPQHIKGRRGE